MPGNILVSNNQNNTCLYASTNFLEANKRKLQCNSYNWAHTKYIGTVHRWCLQSNLSAIYET